MEQVQYEDPNAGLRQFTPRYFEAKGMVGFLLRKGWAKSEKGANLILMAVIVICVLIMVLAVSLAFGGPSQKHYTPEEIQQMQNLPPTP